MTVSKLNQLQLFSYNGINQLQQFKDKLLNCSLFFVVCVRHEHLFGTVLIGSLSASANNNINL